MEINRPQLKVQARIAMTESKTNPYIFTLVYVAITTVLYYLNSNVMNTDAILAAIQSGSTDVLSSVLANAPSGLEYLLGTLLNLMGTMLSVGFMIFALHVWRRRENSIGNLLDGFAMLLRVIGLQIVMTFFVYLWSLLFVIPGFIASIRYSRAMYLLIDNPQMGIMDCLRESKRLMKGRKMEYFVLTLSFFGWILLCSFPVSPFTLLGILSAAISIFVTPYMQVTYAGWHDLVVQQDKQNRDPYSRDGGFPPYMNNDER